LLKGDDIIGFFGLVPVDETCIELKRLYVAAPQRGKAFGSYLLQLALDCAKKMGYGILQLQTTSKFIEAVSLYKKNGFFMCNDVKKAPGHDIALRKFL